jgi:hypothetical protein
MAIVESAASLIIDESTAGGSFQLARPNFAMEPHVF